jgi:hypothetical protein
MPLILPGNVGSATAATGFNVANSCRFDDGSSDHMHKTPGSAGSRIKWTFSVWLKRGVLGQMPIFAVPGGDTSNYDEFYFNDSNKIQYSAMVSGTQYALRTKRMFRDTTAWMHLALIYDSNNGTAGDRMQLWVNGVRTAEADMEDTTFKDAQNYSSSINNDKIHYLGKVTTNTAGIFDGYMAEVVFQNNSADSPVDKFGEFDSDSGIFKPIDVSSLTLGTNGFYLDFEDSSNLGNDVGGGTDLTEVNIDAQNQSTDTCSNNMPVINQLTLHSNNVTVSEGNLVATTGDAPWQSTNCTFGLTTGKWYWEFKATESSTNQYLVLGIQSDNLLSSAANGFGYSNNYSYGFKNYNGEFVYNETDGGGSGSYGSAVTDGQIIGVALDLVNLEIYFSINGTFQNSGDPTSGSSGTGSAGDLQSGQTYFPSLVIARAGGTGTIPIGEYNFGSPPYSESGGNSDADGYGNFAAAPPSGYFSINTKNLAEYGG